VADDGAGIASGREREALAEGHIGLAIAAERVAAVGGALALERLPGGGTRARAVLPFP
jgi:signal transduction histidine kinase